MSAATAAPTALGLDQDERIVEEVHCAECGMPISAIPAWYANVNVRFTCDSCRQKSPRMASAPSAADAEAPAATGSIDSELDAEPALEDLDVDDLEIELDDAEPEAEPDAE